MKPRLILASSSPRRADVLRQLRLAPEVLPAMIDESYQPGETPEEHVERLARRKAQAVSLREPDALVVAGDTVVLDGERVLMKPAGPDDAAAMLASLAGRTHEVLSGLALSGTHGTVSGVARASVHCRSFDAALARRYVASGEPMDKAGAYGIQGLGATLVDRIEGDYYCVVGFPVSVFLDLLERAGWRYDFGSLTRLPR
jgi:nucleoside triphosphate pyrophosphatase